MTERYNYDKGSPGAGCVCGAALRRGHPFQSYVGYWWRYTRVSPYDDVDAGAG